jgi:hypothetical protein
MWGKPQHHDIPVVNPSCYLHDEAGVGLAELRLQFLWDVDQVLLLRQPRGGVVVSRPGDSLSIDILFGEQDSWGTQ